MNVTRIQTCADRIARNEAALKWLEEYGVQLHARDSDQFALTFHANLASACMGAKEPSRPEPSCPYPDERELARDVGC